MQRERFLENLYDQSEGSRFRGQDSVRRSVDVDLAKARELRDVSGSTESANDSRGSTDMTAGPLSA
jgi:hypothetical protein